MNERKDGCCDAAAWIIDRPWAAGVWEQRQPGTGLAIWSRHCRRDLAERAARRYARECAAPAGGPLTWAGGVRAPDERVTWLDGDGDVIVVVDGRGEVVS